MYEDLTFDDIVEIYVASTEHRSKDRDQYSIRCLSPMFSGKKLSDIKRLDIRAYIQKRRQDNVKDTTINRELRFFSAAINFVALELEITLRNPVQAMKLQPGELRVRWISHDEAKALVAAAESYQRIPHLACFIRLALSTGCRKSELLELEWARVNFEAGLLIFESKHNKSKKRKTVPVNAPALQALRILKEWTAAHHPESPWVFTSQRGRRIVCMKRGFTAACERAGITDFRIHDMCHTCASWLVMSGVPLMVVRDLLGHYSVTVTEIYAHLAPSQVQSAVNSLPYL